MERGVIESINKLATTRNYVKATVYELEKPCYSTDTAVGPFLEDWTRLENGQLLGHIFFHGSYSAGELIITSAFDYISESVAATENCILRLGRESADTISCWSYSRFVSLIVRSSVESENWITIGIDGSGAETSIGEFKDVNKACNFLRLVGRAI